MTGMKKGAGEDPFANDDTAETEHDGTADTGSSEAVQNEQPAAANQVSSTGSEPGRTLPYIHARDGVKDERSQRPMWVQTDTEDALAELVDEMSDRFDENVYRTDVIEAALLAGAANPDAVAAKLREWGYGLK